MSFAVPALEESDQGEIVTDSKRVLLVDDEEDITWAISKSLRNSGNALEVVCANDGNVALQLLHQQAFDLVISDIRMPGKDGLQLVLDIRKLHPETKVIIMTAYGSAEVMERADKLGSFFYIEKPFEIGYLKRLVFQALQLEAAGFSGAVDSAQLRDLVQLYCSTRSSSSLFISDANKQGKIYFNNGDVVHAECGTLLGERAFYNILNWTNGTFEINHNDRARNRTISRDWRSLLHQCV